MKIIVAGGTGFIGHHVCQTLIENEHHVTVLTRNATQARAHCPREVSVVDWGTLKKETEQTIGGVDAFINLAGAPIADARWTPTRKQLLIDSRIDTTRQLVESMGRVSEKPQVFINASGIGYYGANEKDTLSETSPPGQGFLAELCQKWEHEANRAAKHGVRVICLRIGMVLGSDGGALNKMKTPFKLFVGGPISPGTQKISWIHRHDLARLIIWLLDQTTLSGPINAVAPQCVTMNEFCSKLGDALHRPSWMPVPAFALKLLLGELSDMLITGQHVVSRVNRNAGFSFKYPTLEQALQSIFRDESR